MVRQNYIGQVRMKLARTIRFDRSDINVFPLAADEGEWALVGTFCFAEIDEAKLTGKVKQAFSNGFIGLQSFGFSTLVSVATAKKQDLDTIETILAERFIREFGAPDDAAASGSCTRGIGFHGGPLCRASDWDFAGSSA